MSYNFQISNCDTDSISFCSPEGKSYSPEERKALVKEINDLSPEFMLWDDDGYYSKVIILKAKNYILFDGQKITYKGSALKDSKKEPGLKQFLHDIIDSILTEKFNYSEIYNNYVKEILNLKDITRWCSKKTLSSTTYSSTRANETKVIEAIKGTEYKEGDKIYTYFDVDENLKLADNFDHDHHVGKLLKKLYATAMTFKNIIPKETFINYSLKNKKIQELLDGFR